MSPSKFSILPLISLCAAAGLLLACNPAASPEARNSNGTGQPVSKAARREMHVSPTARENGDGSPERPFSTLQEALQNLPASGGGTMILHGGIYKGEWMIRLPSNAEGEPELLTLRAAPGETVVFEGGESMAQWKPWKDESGMFVCKADDITTAFAYEAGYLDIWEAPSRIRYRKQADEAGVRAYPGSTCMLDEETILIHTRDGRTPDELGIWRNRGARGVTIARNHVVLEGVHFRNFLGGRQARALTLARGTKQITIADCTFDNCVRGINVNGADTLIKGCEFRDVSNGITTHGNDTVVEDCVIQSAVGLFAISDLNQHLRNGIRFYFPAAGGSVRNTLTGGFWAGLYVKTYTAEPHARPMQFEHNVFTDGIRSGCARPQALNRYHCNIIGPNEDGVDPLKDNDLAAASLEHNYVYARPKAAAKGTNRRGANPFVDLGRGDLRFSSGHAISSCPHAEDAAPKRKERVTWSPGLAAMLKEQLSPRAKRRPLSFAGIPQATSSSRGAVITATLSGPGEPVLYYRRAGDERWVTAKGIPNRPARSAPSRATAPFDPSSRVSSASPYLFVVPSESPDKDYEGYLEVSSGKGAIRSDTIRWRTSGGVKELFVQAGSQAESADGSPEKPFAQLQEALDRALPGDTVTLKPGVYTAPAFLAHGGTADAPLTIQGAGAEVTMLDGGKEPSALLVLDKANHVAIRDLEVRWFGDSGIAATDSTHGTIERCRFFNTPHISSTGANGSGILLSSSPGWTISHCVFTGLEHGVRAFHSPEIKIRNNTAFRNFYTSVFLSQSLRGSEVTGNSFTFTGNESFRISESDQQALATFQSDFNNFGNVLRKESKDNASEQNFTPSSHYGRIPESKVVIRAVIAGETLRFRSLDDWKAFAGKDAHSLWADPKYRNPGAGDFTLLPDSPNLLSDGRVIGALPAQTK